MNYLGIETEIKNIPKLDEGFIPLYKFNEAFLKTASVPVGIAVERHNGERASVRTFVHGTEAMKKADEYYIDRLVKTLLWMKGGYRVLVCGDEAIFSYLKSAFCAGGRREFDALFMQKLFGIWQILQLTAAAFFIIRAGGIVVFGHNILRCK